jgi:hypothetical protein
LSPVVLVCNGATLRLLLPTSLRRGPDIARNNADDHRRLERAADIVRNADGTHRPLDALAAVAAVTALIALRSRFASSISLLSLSGSRSVNRSTRSSAVSWC